MILAMFSYNTRPEDREDFIQAAKDCGLLDGAPNENGCLSYRYVLPVGEAGKTICIECWENEAAFAAHKDQPHTKRFQDVKARYVTSVDAPAFYRAEPMSMNL